MGNAAGGKGHSGEQGPPGAGGPVTRRQRLEDDLEQRTAELVEANRQLIAEAEERERLGQTVRDLAERISRWRGRRLELGAMLDEAAATIGLALQVDLVTVRLAENERLGSLVVTWKAPGVEHTFGTASTPRAMAILEQLGKRGKSLPITDIAEFTYIKQDRENASTFLGAGVKSIVLTPILAGDGTYLGTVGLAHTSRIRQWSAEDVALAESLARAVARAVQQVKLYEDQLALLQSLQDLDRAKSEFLLTVSHELRTPLTSVSGYLELLRTGEGGAMTEEQDQLLAVVDRNVGRLVSLVDDVVTLCQLDLGAMDARPVPASISEAIARAADRVRAGRPDGTFTLHLDGADPGLEVVGDPEAIERLFFAVLDNAVKFGPSDGHVEIEVRKAGSTVSTTVRNLGIGIHSEDQPRIFDRFYRASNASELQIPGSGLGLAIARSIVERHGGSITVRSEVGESTTFSIELPTADPDR